MHTKGRHRQRKKWTLASAGRLMTALAVTIIAATACDPPIALEATGSISVRIGDNDGAKTLVADTSMVVESYQLSGTGPDGTSIEPTNIGDSATVDNLVPGTWLLTVDALNVNQQKIGTGSASTNVRIGEIMPVTVPVQPIEGSGTLAITVSWPADILTSPSAQGVLISATGEETPLAFSADSATSQAATETGVPTGAYTVVVQLFDEGHVAAGIAEAAHVAANSTTTGEFAFTSVRPRSAGTVVNIDTEMNDPLDIDLNGAFAEIGSGQGMTLEASASGASEPVTYTWYLDGEYMDTGATYTTATDLVLGPYELSVVGTTPTQGAGSTTHGFAVVDPNGLILQPTDLEATAQSPIESNGVLLTWTDNSDNEDGFVIERKDASGEFQEIGRVGADATEYRDLGTKFSIVAASASSMDGTNVPENVYDNNLSTRWSAEGTDEWIVLDLGTEQRVANIGLAFFKGNERQAYFDVETSTDGTIFSTALSNVTASGTTLLIEYYPFGPVQARYVRITGHGNSENLWNSINEAQLRGSTNLMSGRSYTYRVMAHATGASSYASTVETDLP